MSKEELEITEIRDDLSFKWVVTRHLDRIAEMASRIVDITAGSESIIDAYGRSVNLLENLLYPYLGPNYKQDLEGILKEIEDEANTTGAERELLYKYNKTGCKLKELMKLLASRGLLLEESTSIEI